MKILSLDTSTNNFSLCVADGEKVLAKKDIVLNKILSDSIVPTIDKVLTKAKVPLSELDGFAVGLGPGSFTSLRVGLSTVKALAFAGGKPVVGIPSLDVIAQGVPAQKNQDICVVCDARRSLVYAAFYRKQGQRLTRRGKYLLAGIEAVLSQVTEPTLVVGNGIALFREAIKKAKGTEITLAEEKFWYPRAVNLSQLAYSKFSKKEYNDIDSLVPLYLYSKDCQVVR